MLLKHFLGQTGWVISWCTEKTCAKHMYVLLVNMLQITENAFVCKYKLCICCFTVWWGGEKAHYQTWVSTKQQHSSLFTMTWRKKSIPSSKSLWTELIHWMGTDRQGCKCLLQSSETLSRWWSMEKEQFFGTHIAPVVWEGAWWRGLKVWWDTEKLVTLF